MTRTTISVVTVDTLLFSCIGVLLFHSYRVINRSGTHGAFRGLYMRRLHAFRVGCDVVTSAPTPVRSRRCSMDVADIASGHGRTDGRFSPRPKVTRRSVSRARRPHRPVRGAGSSRTTGSVRPHRSEANTVQALMDLALPRFEGLGDGPRQVHRPWKISVAWEDLGDSSVPLSPNRVQPVRSQDVPDEGSLFHVSPVPPGFLMRPSGATGQHPQARVLLPTTLDDFSDDVGRFGSW